MPTPKMISPHIEVEAFASSFRAGKPFHHVVIGDFFEASVAEALAKEFPDFDSEIWSEYNNPIETKKLCNRWDKFPPVTYSVFCYLTSSALQPTWGRS